MDIVSTIENDLVAKRLKKIAFLPKPLKKQLKKIEDIVFHIWGLDSVYQGQIRIDCLQACSNTTMIIDELESAIKNNGQELAKIYEWEKALIKITKTIVKKKKK